MGENDSYHSRNRYFVNKMSLNLSYALKTQKDYIKILKGAPHLVFNIWKSSYLGIIGGIDSIAWPWPWLNFYFFQIYLRLERIVWTKLV